MFSGAISEKCILNLHLKHATHTLLKIVCHVYSVCVYSITLIHHYFIFILICIQCVVFLGTEGPGSLSTSDDEVEEEVVTPQQPLARAIPHSGIAFNAFFFLL